MAGARKTFAVIGDPVAHSLSPRIFSRFFADLGIDAHFTAMRVTPDELPEAIERVRRGAIAGLSVTIPHKVAAARLVDSLHPLAARIGAVNCVAHTKDRFAQGFNTDAMGFRLALQQAGILLPAARVLLLGAGGAARAAAFAAVDAGAKGLVLANRDIERAYALGLELVAQGHAWPEGTLLRRWEESRPHARGPWLTGPSGKSFVAALPLDAAALAHPLAHADVLVNATSVGLGEPDADPLPASSAVDGHLTVLDMVYRPLETALLRRAAAAGARIVDGLWMLLHQANEQLHVWTGRRAPQALVGRMHAELSRECA
ncbi:MAG TPA: shikimate dehydrogenase [Vulgatibacter sp.]